MSIKSKLHKIIPGYIRKRGGGGQMRPIPTVEAALTEVGKCCGVDLCGGVVRHYDPVSGGTKGYQVLNGFFGPGVANGKLPSTAKTQMMPNVVEHIGMDSHPMHNIEGILNEQANCCGADCCGAGMIRLPNHDEGVIYEFGVQGVAVIAPRVVADIKPSKLPKRHYKIFPQSIFKKTVRGQKRVKYFEHIQEDMVNKQSYYGFNCCEGYIFLPDLNVPGDYYQVSIVAGAFVLTEVDSCNKIIPEEPGNPPALVSDEQGPPTIIITSPDCTEFAPATALLDGIFIQGMNILISLTYNSGGTESFTYTVPTDQSAEITAQGIVNLGNTQIPTLTFSSNGEVIAILAGAGETLVLTNFSIV